MALLGGNFMLGSHAVVCCARPDATLILDQRSCDKLLILRAKQFVEVVERRFVHLVHVSVPKDLSKIKSMYIRESAPLYGRRLVLQSVPV